MLICYHCFVPFLNQKSLQSYFSHNRMICAVSVHSWWGSAEGCHPGSETPSAGSRGARSRYASQEEESRCSDGEQTTTERSSGTWWTPQYCDLCLTCAKHKSCCMVHAYFENTGLQNARFWRTELFVHSYLNAAGFLMIKQVWLILLLLKCQVGHSSSKTVWDK